MDTQNLCRTCLATGKSMQALSDSISIAGEQVCLSDILQTFYNYKVDPEDLLPQRVCVDCVYQITITYSFKILIESSAKSLTECVNDIDSDKDTLNIINLPISDIKSCENDEKEYRTSQLGSLLCTECKEHFESVPILYEHCKKMHPPKSEVGRECDYCNQKFEDFKSLILHRKRHMTPHVCEVCWEGFPELDDMRQHKCIVLKNCEDKEPEKVYRQCDQCGKSYPQSYIQVHMKIHSEKRNYSCDYCSQTFKVRCSLNSHVLWKHKRTRNHQCNICNGTFVSASSKSAHIRKHHLNEKKNSCETCGKGFFSKSELERHLLTHTGVKNFHCHICTKSYQARYGLNVHLRSHNRLPVQSFEYIRKSRSDSTNS